MLFKLKIGMEVMMFLRFLMAAGLMFPALCLADSAFSWDNSPELGWADHSLTHQDPEPAIHSLSDKPALRLASTSSSNPEIIITNWQYRAGGVIGATLGFGLGHAVQKRWTKTGWIFTAGRIGLGFMSTRTLKALVEALESDHPRRELQNFFSSKASTMMLTVFLSQALRLWEIIDVLAPPDYVKIAGGKEKPLSTSPLLYTRNSRLYKGLKFQFQF